MATYKLIQDIEAEDKILGPLTLRQFIFAIIMCFFAWISFLVARSVPFLLVIFLPITVFFGFFAFPFGRDQPTELWALAKLRYWFKPRQRLWNQSGVKELVTITVPKKVEHVFTNGLSQTEVQSRLHALANTIDSRGWAIKNVSSGTYIPIAPVEVNSDRLIDIAHMPQEVPTYQIAAADDILDETNNPIARQFDAMITQSSQAHRKQLIDQLRSTSTTPVNAPAASVTVQQASGAAEPWFLNPSQPAAEPGHLTATDKASEAALSAELKAHASAQQVTYGNLQTIQPLGTTPPDASTPVVTNNASAMTATDDPAILSLANNNDLNVATLAREAHKARHENDPLHDEVVISLR